MCVLTASTPESKHPRNMFHTKKLDTLKLSERFSVKSNGLGWLMLSPNIGVEMTLGNHNWNRLTLGVNGRIMQTISRQQYPYVQRHLNEGRMEARYYWHGEGLLRSWFAGGYGGYTKFDLKLGETGYRGNGFISGITAGTIAPLYGYRNGGSLDLELSVNAGMLWADVENYVCADGRESYLLTSESNGQHLVWDALPYIATCDVIRVSFVYHFGPSVADRYHKRITIDEDFRNLQNELALQRDSIEQARKQQKALRQDSLEKVDYEQRFEKQRKELEQKHLRDSLERVKQRLKNEK